MASKYDHRNRLQLLALDSITDVALKDFLKHLIADKTFFFEDGGDEKVLRTSTNENKALSEIFNAGKPYLKELFILRYPEIQNVIFTDETMNTMKDEILIKNLDIGAVCNILLKFPLMPTHVEHEHEMTNTLEDILYLRMVTANHFADTFWNALTTGSIKLNKYPNFTSWNDIWNHAKGNVLTLLTFLKREGVCAENQHKKMSGEIKLITAWSKQEILQNYSTQISSQLRALQYLNNIEQPFTEQKQVEVKIKISEISTNQEQDGFWVTSALLYFKSFIWQLPRDSLMKPYGLDGKYAIRIEQKFKAGVKEIFGEKALLSCIMNSITVNPTKLEPCGDTFIPLTLLVYTDMATTRDTFTDPQSESARTLWLTIKQEISNCLDNKMDIYVDVIRTGWKESGKITACVFKKNKFPWSQDECSLVIDVLQKWHFPLQIRLYSDTAAMEQHAIFTFNLTTVSQPYFDLLQEFASHFHKNSEERIIYVQKDDVDIQIFHKNLLEQFKSKGVSIAEKFKKVDRASKTSCTDDQLLAINENSGQKPSLPKRKLSGQTTPRTMGGTTPRHPSMSREGSLVKINVTMEKSPRKSSVGEKKGIPSPRGIPVPNKKGIPSPREFPVGNKKGIASIKERIVGEKEDSLENSSIPDNGWIKLMIAVEYILKPAMLQILHNDRKDPAIKGLPREPKELYACVVDLKRRQPKAFERWRKHELKVLLSGGNGQNEVNSNQFTLDMIYFLLRFKEVIEPPKNGWVNPKPPSLSDENTLAYHCWDTININQELSVVATADKSNMAEMTNLVQRIEKTLKGLQYESPLLKKLKREDLPTFVNKNVTF